MDQSPLHCDGMLFKPLCSNFPSFPSPFLTFLTLFPSPPTPPPPPPFGEEVFPRDYDYNTSFKLMEHVIYTRSKKRNTAAENPQIERGVSSCPDFENKEFVLKEWPCLFVLPCPLRLLPQDHHFILLIAVPGVCSSR